MEDRYFANCERCGRTLSQEECNCFGLLERAYKFYCKGCFSSIQDWIKRKDEEKRNNQHLKKTQTRLNHNLLNFGNQK